MTEATPSAPIFQHGLLKPRRQHMSTLFTLIIFWLVGTIVGLVLLPYEAQRFTDGWWTDNQHILFLTSLCFVSTLHGALAYMMGYSRGGRVSNFFLGAFLLTLGLLVVLFLNGNRPEAPPAQSTGLMKKLDRFAYALGNIYFGITQIAILGVFLYVATTYESLIGAEIGNQAAYAAFYNHWSLGLLFVLFFVTIFCATMRKWPFRIAQIGWLATHLGLLITMAGCMVMFWGTYDGFVKLLEGETVTAVNSRTEREVRVAIPALRFDQKFLIEVDRDPTKHGVDQEIPFVIEGSERDWEFKLRIDRFYPRAEEWRGLKERRRAPGVSNEEAKAGATFVLSAPGSAERDLFALEDSPQLSRGLPLSPTFIRIPHRSQLEAFGYRYAPGDTARGRLIAEDDRGRELLSVAINPGPRGQDARLGASVSTRATLPNGAVVAVDRYYSYLVAEAAGLRDESPGSPLMPGIRFTVSDPQGTEHHSARMDGHWFNSDTQKSADSRHPYRFRYVARASNPRPKGSLTYVAGPGKERNIVLTGFDGRAQILPFEEDRTYRFSPTAPITIKALKAFDDARYVEEVRNAEKNQPSGIRVTVEHETHSEKTWLFNYQRDLLSETVRLGDLVVRLGYAPRQTDLDYAISLVDFRHENYPNSTKAKRFEANVLINDGDESGIDHALVDMNNPLFHRGFRFYNSNPIGDDDGRRGVVFSVGSNPGLPTLIIGFTITGIGLLLVFFFKPLLRRWETRRRETRGAA